MDPKFEKKNSLEYVIVFDNCFLSFQKIVFIFPRKKKLFST